MPRSHNFDLRLPAFPDLGLDPRVYAEFLTLYSSLKLLADQVAGDNMLEWVDHSAASTVVGFSSLSTREIQYRYLNLNTVLITFRLIGVSSGTTTSFTLPSTSASYLACPAGLTGDNSVLSATSGQVICSSGSNLVSLYRDSTGAIWTASGTKSIAGQFIYRSN